MYTLALQRRSSCGEGGEGGLSQSKQNRDLSVWLEKGVSLGIQLLSAVLQGRHGAENQNILFPKKIRKKKNQNKKCEIRTLMHIGLGFRVTNGYTLHTTQQK